MTLQPFSREELPELISDMEEYIQWCQSFKMPIIGPGRHFPRLIVTLRSLFDADEKQRDLLKAWYSTYAHSRDCNRDAETCEKCQLDCETERLTAVAENTEEKPAAEGR